VESCWAELGEALRCGASLELGAGKNGRAVQRRLLVGYWGTVGGLSDGFLRMCRLCESVMVDKRDR